MVRDIGDKHSELPGQTTVSENCVICGGKPTVGIDFIPYYDYIVGHVPDKFRYLYEFCDEHFIRAYKNFYKNTNVGWEINFSSSDSKEVREIVADTFARTYGQHNSDRVVHTDGGRNTSSIRDAWSVPVQSDTKSWKRNKGGKV